jgi:hypothetical protein
MRVNPCFARFNRILIQHGKMDNIKGLIPFTKTPYLLSTSSSHYFSLYLLECGQGRKDFF